MKQGKEPEARVPSVVNDHIAAITELEKRWLQERKIGEHLGDATAAQLGSIHMVIIHGIWFSTWFSINLGWIPGIRPFDPYPFGLLTMLVSLEAIFLSLFLLISQNRLTRQADKRAHLDIQVNLLVETEVSAMLRLLRPLCEKLGVDYEAEVRELGVPTDLRKMVQAVETIVNDGDGDTKPPPGSHPQKP